MGVAAQLGLRPQESATLGGLWPAATRSGAMTSRPATWIFVRMAHHLDRLAVWSTRGRRTVTESLFGLPTLMLTTTGARSGLARTVPVVPLLTGDDVAAIGSNFGQASHPAWVHNLRADPDAELAHDGHRVAVRAREVTGAEADRIWDAARALYAGFSVYPTRTDRRIAVFVFEPR